MSKATRAGTKWKCPECGRDFRIKTKTPPERCRQCAARVRKAVAPVSEQPVGVAPVVDDPPVVSRLSQPKELPPEVEAHIGRQEREQVLRHLENISRTMTFFRRLVWAMVILMILNTAIMGIAFFYSTRGIGGIGGLLGGEAGANQPGGEGGQVGQQLQDIRNSLKEYADVLEDLQQPR